MPVFSSKFKASPVSYWLDTPAVSMLITVLVLNTKLSDIDKDPAVRLSSVGLVGGAL